MRGRGGAALALAALAAALLPCVAHAAQLLGIRSAEHAREERLRVVFDLDSPVSYRLEREANAADVVLVIEGAEPAGEMAPATAVRAPRWVRGVELTAMDAGSAVAGAEPLEVPSIRVRLQLAAADLGLSHFLLKPEHDRPHRLVLDIAPRIPASGLHPGYAVAPGSPAAAQRNPGPAKPPTAMPITATSRSPDEAQRNPGPAEPPTAMPITATQRSPDAAKRNPGSPPPRQTTTPTPIDITLSGTWEHEFAWSTERGEFGKSETRIHPRWDIGLGDNLALTAIARLRFDAIGDLGPAARTPDNYSAASAPWYNSEHAELSLREFYADFRLGNTDWRLGKQQVVWGQADGIKLLDVLNPQTFREFILDDFDESRIPLWMATANIPVGAANLQLIWIPDTTYHELPDLDATFAVRSPRLVPPLPVVALAEAERPDDPLKDGDLGLALSTFAGGWDLSLNYLYHYVDQPLLPVQPLAPGTLPPGALPPGLVGAPGVLPPLLFAITPRYERSHLLGGTFGTAIGSLTLRGEFAYNSDTFQPLDPFAGRTLAAPVPGATPNQAPAPPPDPLALLTLAARQADPGWQPGAPLPAGFAVGRSAEFSAVLGIDWSPDSDTLLSAQLYNSHLFDHQRSMARDRDEQLLTLLYQRDFANASWRLRGIGMHSINDGDRLLQLKLSHWFTGNLQLWLGADLFGGTRRGVFGQYRENDRVLMGFEYGF